MNEAKSRTLTRLQDQLDWYDRKSIHNQFWYKWLRTLSILASLSIPIVTIFETESWVVALIASLVSLIEASLQIRQFHSNWMSYRTTCEQLKHEKFLFLASAGHYKLDSEDDRFRLLAERIEELISTEHTMWSRKQSKDLSRSLAEFKQTENAGE